MHIGSVCNSTFQKFIAGQVTEAIILATLCTIGMLILRIPYALMVGCLIGVTALIPIIGAFIAGSLGMLLGVPAVSAIYTLVKEATCSREQQLNNI